MAPKKALASHRTNYYHELALPDLATLLKRFQERLKAIVYCPRNNAPNVFDFRKRTGIVTLLVISVFVSKSKQKDKNLIKEYYQLHQKRDLDLNLITLVLTPQSSLRRLHKKTHHSKLNKRRRRAKKNEKLAAEAAAASLSNYVYFFLVL